MGIEISHMTRHSGKPNKLRNVNPVRGRTGNVTINIFHLHKRPIQHVIEAAVYDADILFDCKIKAFQTYILTFAPYHESDFP